MSFISPAHKRTEGRAPVWGSEFTSKDAALQGGVPAETAARLNVKLCVLVVRGGDSYRPYVFFSFFTSAKQGRFLKVCKSAKRAPILDLRPVRLWEERRASAGGLWRDQIALSSPR